MKYATFILLLLTSSISHGEFDVEKIVPRLEIYNPSELESRNSKKCEILLKNIKEEKVSFIKPDIYNSKKKFLEAKKYFGECDPKNFIEFHHIGNRVHSTTTLKEIEEKGGDINAQTGYFASEYRVYKGDIDHDGAKEHLVYGSCMHNESENFECKWSFSDFTAINLKSCALDKRRQVVDIESKYNPSSFVGVFSLDNKEYYFDGKRWEFEGFYTFNTYEPIIKKGGNSLFFGSQCFFKAAIPNKSTQATPKSGAPGF